MHMQKINHSCRCLLSVGYLKTLLEVDGGIHNKYMRSDTVMKCHILAVLWKAKALGREKKDMQTTKVIENWDLKKKICSTLERLTWSISLGNLGKERTKFNVKTHKNRELGREHPLGLNLLDSDCILHIISISLLKFLVPHLILCCP